MEPDTLAPSTPTGPPPARQAVRMARRLARAVLLLLLLSMAGLTLVGVLVAVQSRSVDLRQADAILVLDAPCAAVQPPDALPCPRQELLDHALDLYRRGLAQRLLLADAAGSGHAYLLANGVPDQALLVEREGQGSAPQLRLATRLARANGVASVLLVGAPYQMLRGLKITRDLGLVAYAAPLSARVNLADPTQLRLIAGEAGAYWRYVFLGQ